MSKPQNIALTSVTMPSAIYQIEGSRFAMSMETVEESRNIFDEDEDINFLPIVDTNYMYASFGGDNKLPFEIIKKIGEDEVMSQNKFFNVLTCYGAGLQYRDVKTHEQTRDVEIRKFFRRNQLHSFYLEQSTDMKYFFFAVAVVILSKDGKKINRIRHKDACYCRFEKADKKGVIRHVFYANWRKDPQKADIEVLELLDLNDPIGDLMVRMGREPGGDGRLKVRTNERKFAIVMRFPTPGCQYYPMPYYTAIFRGDWFDIKKMIGKGKKAKLRNHASVKYQVEVHKDYWNNILNDEHITDPLKRMERIKKEKENIKNFVSGIENSGKVWISGFNVNPEGKEVRMVRINLIDTGKEGGDWSEDIQEASNMTCYGDNIHPNLVGATPGKSQSNNSGSDKRELFTLKQSLEIAFHHLMSIPHDLIIEYNGWDDKVEPDVPMIMLTTLDKHTDAQKKTAEPLNNDDDDNN